MALRWPFTDSLITVHAGTLRTGCLHPQWISHIKTLTSDLVSLSTLLMNFAALRQTAGVTNFGLQGNPWVEVMRPNTWAEVTRPNPQVVVRKPNQSPQVRDQLKSSSDHVWSLC